MGSTADTKELLTRIIRALVDDGDSVKVVATPDPGGSIVYAVRVAPKDVGKVIGSQGRTARSIRTILNAVARKHDESYLLDIQGSWIDEG